MLINSNTWQTSLALQTFNAEIPVDDSKRIDLVQDYVAGHIDKHWIESLTAISARARRLSPPAFRYQLTEMARSANKRIVLPEGEEPRTIAAAAICSSLVVSGTISTEDPWTFISGSSFVPNLSIAIINVTPCFVDLLSAPLLFL